MNDTEFQDTVLKGVQTLEGKIKQRETEHGALLENIKSLSSDTKGALEDFQKLKAGVNDQAEALTKLQRALAALRTEHGRQFGDPIQRFCASEERKAWLMGCFKRAAGMPLNTVERTAVTGVDTGVGQYTTPQETAAMIYDALLTYGQWNTLGIMPVGSRTQIIPLVTARPTAYWVASGAQITEGAITGSYVTLTVKEAAAWIPVARAALDDSAVDLAGYLLQQLAQAVAYRLDWACFAADGTNDSTDGAYTGIAVGGTAANAAAGNTTVSNLDLEDFVRCLTTVDAGVLQRPCKWWIHPQIIAKLVLIRDANKRPIFQMGQDNPNPKSIGSILGYPVIPTAAMPSTDAASQVVAVFGEPEGAAVGLRKEIEMARSDEFQFDYNRSAFRQVVRAGFIIKSATSFAMLTTPAA